jgi:hypothetical protein
MGDPDFGFASGTLIRTQKGLGPIKAVNTGDWVLSFPDDQSRYSGKLKWRSQI